jgi:hypothetical protein
MSAHSESVTAGTSLTETENKPALWSLILGLAAIPTALAFGVGAAVGAVAIYLGIKGRRLAQQGAGRMPLAVVGIVAGTIGILMVVGYLLDQAGV